MINEVSRHGKTKRKSCSQNNVQNHSHKIMSKITKEPFP